MKKKIAIGAIAVSILFALYLWMKPDSLTKKAEKLQENLISYQLVGSMEVSTKEDFKNYLITSLWMKKDDQEYFKVSMLDKNLNQEQIILKNTEGVYVVTPALNQVFKFQGEWPMNSPKPYLLQTMLEIIEGECEISSQGQGYVINAPANYPSASTLVTQEIVMTKDLKPISLKAYNGEGTVELQMDFTEAIYNEPIETSAFDTPNTNIQTPTSAYTGLIELPLYPMAVFDSKLTSSTVSSNGKETSHILEFSGGKEFTVIQKAVSKNQELSVKEIEGELVEGLGLIGYYNGNRLTVVNSQMETSVYSDTLSVNEMLQVVESMQVSVMK